MTLNIKSFALLAIALCIGITSANAQNAPDIAPQPCDTEYWKQMSARAWMEAEREIMMNQNLIFKPDSVLEYTCFDQMVNLTASKGGKIFSHTNYFGQPIMEEGDDIGLTRSLDKVVYSALQTYINGNFGHDFLGGRAQKLTIGNKDSQLVPPVPGVEEGYLCNTMANVWQAAKCANFIDNDAYKNTDGFYPFKTIKGHNGTPAVAGYDSIQETRLFPTSCASLGGPPGGGGYGHNLGPAGTWLDQIALANNVAGNGELYPFKQPLSEIYENVNAMTAAYGSDNGEGGTVQCGSPIATGVTVFTSTSNSENWADGVCLNSGCRYQRGGSGSLGECVPIQ